MLKSVERPNNVAFIRSDANVYEAAAIYEESFKDGWYMDALLITKNGKNGQGLEGIAVLEDIAHYLKMSAVAQ